MIYSFGEFDVDVRRFELRRNGAVVAVEPQVFDVLALLVRVRDRVVTKTEIFDTVWGSRFVSESTPTSRIKALRRAVGDDGRAQRIVRTRTGGATGAWRR
ncbi:MAG TPA: winged helix-turn-helix domain-containing protein [Acidimicrobiales bacterium]